MIQAWLKNISHPQLHLVLIILAEGQKCHFCSVQHSATTSSNHISKGQIDTVGASLTRSNIWSNINHLITNVSIIQEPVTSIFIRSQLTGFYMMGILVNNNGLIPN